MDPMDLYFILTKECDYPRSVHLGSICYISKSRYKIETNRKTPSKLPVIPLSSRSGLDYLIETICLEPLSLEEAELLHTVSDDADRLKWFKDKSAIRTALSLTVGTMVTVEEDGKELRGTIRYIGPKPDGNFRDPLKGKYFGVELQGQDRGKGNMNGTVQYGTLFHCDNKCGLLVPFSKLRPIVPTSLSPSAPEPSQQELNVGDRVTYFIDNKCRHGMVVDMQEHHGKHVVRISTDTDESGNRGGEVLVPLDLVAKGEVPAEPDRVDVDTEPMETDATDLYLGLSVDSMVEVNAANLKGIIRWIGNVPGREELMAGLELEEEKGVTDGTIKGQRFFTCPPKRALFVKLSSCRPDSRFQISSDNQNLMQREDRKEELDQTTGKLETVPPISSEEVNQLLIGRMRGIQGHCNSCYMDAALFSLFSCSSVLDSMLFKSTSPQDAPIQRTLLQDIVNPLRSKGFVEAQHVMKLRQQLQKHGYSHSFTTEEKDPEEFLIVIMHHILALDPLLKLSAGGKVQESYCYQIFLDQNHSLVLPTVQQLLEHSFHSGGLKLAEAPSCLILQMPRFGKKFKLFDKIIPSLELDVTDLLSEGPQQCILCAGLAVEECSDCFKDQVFSSTGFKIFCKSCSKQVHSHPQRRLHRPLPLDVPSGFSSVSLTRDKLELFAVLCIETSHYVSFVKYGPNAQDWIFFDSMADRHGERDGFNIPEVRFCPEVGSYLEMTPAELANQVPRDMRGVAKRLFCDAYMYLYQNTSMCLYC